MQQKSFFGNLIAVLAIAFLTSCGGGGSASSAPNSAAINSSPSSSILSSSSSILSSSPIISSVLPSSSTTSSIFPSSSSSSSSSKKLDPIITEKTSYLNKLKAGDPNHGKAYSMIAVDGPSKGQVHRPLAYGDFFQDGTFAVFATSYPDNGGRSVADHFSSVVKFFHRTADGTGWVDRTSELLKDGTGCITLKKASVADFNGDGKPDLYLGCHGADIYGSVGEHQRILLSQPDGAYTNNQVPLICYCHGSTAGDINGDGNIDILAFDSLDNDAEQRRHPIALMGNGDGTFTNNPEYAPKSLYPMSVWTLELIDSGRGMLDLFVGGNSTLPGREWWPTDFANSVLYNDGDGKFTSEPVVLDNTLGKTFYNLALDFIVKDGFVYIAQVGDEYKSNAVRKVNLADPTQSELLYEHAGIAGVGPDIWYPWLTLLSDGHIATMCDYSNTVDSWCTWTEN